MGHGEMSVKLLRSNFLAFCVMSHVFVYDVRQPRDARRCEGRISVFLLIPLNCTFSRSDVSAIRRLHSVRRACCKAIGVSVHWSSWIEHLSSWIEEV